MDEELEAGAVRRRSPARRRLYDALLVGVPFGIFKVAAGWTIAARGSPLLGQLVIAWGIVDMVLNGVAFLAPARVSYCLLSNLGLRVDRRTHHTNWEERLLALDTLLSFAIVSLMIWYRFLPALPPWLGRTWDAAVVFNVMGVGVERLYLALRRDRLPVR